MNTQITSIETQALNPRLSNIRCSMRQSQATPCFTATLDVAGTTFEVSNDGRGGANRYQPYMEDELQTALDQLCAHNLPPIEAMGDKFPMSFETWTFCAAYDSTAKNRSAQLLK